MKILAYALLIIWYPFYYTGLLLYFITKPLRALGFLLMIRPNTALEEISEDWTSQPINLRDL